jgi:hypothetical protein
MLSRGTVNNAAAGGMISSAHTLHADQIFSQRQFRVNFMGRVKLAFMMPASNRIAIPEVVLPIVSLSFVSELQSKMIDTREKNPCPRSK